MLTVLVLLMAVQVFAQKSIITGVVKNIDGMPIVGAAVQEKGLTNSTITDPEGKFSLQVYDGKALIVKMKGYYTQVIKLEEGTVNLDNIVLVKVERWEFGLSAGLSGGRNYDFYDFNDSKDWYYRSNDGLYRLGFDDSRVELNGGAYVFFSPCKRNIRIKTLIGFGLTFFSKKINTIGIVRDKHMQWLWYDYYQVNAEGWECNFSFKQVINTLDLSFLIKHKIRVRKSGICLMYGPLCGVAITNPLNIYIDNFTESYHNEEDDSWITNNVISESKSGITYKMIEEEMKKDFGNKFVLGGLGALGFEYPSGVGVWGTYTMRCYQTKAGCWNMRVPSFGAALTYKF